MLSIFKKRKISEVPAESVLMPEPEDSGDAGSSAPEADHRPESRAPEETSSAPAGPDQFPEMKPAERQSCPDAPSTVPAEPAPAAVSASDESESGAEAAPAEERDPAPTSDEASSGDSGSGTDDAHAEAPEEISPADTLAMPEAAVPFIPAGPAERIFGALSCAAPVVLILLAVAMTGITAWLGQGLFFPDAGRITDAVMNVSPNSWPTLTAGGAPCPDMPPLFVWFAAALATVPCLPSGAAPLLASAAAYAAFIVSVWALAASSGSDRRTAFASGLTALCCAPAALSFSALGPELLSASLSTAAMACLYRGWTKGSAPFLLGSGFILLGLSAMAWGPLGIAVAVSSSIVFLFWRGTPGRLNGRDGLPGFLLMLLMFASWFSVLYLGGNEEYLHGVLAAVLAPCIGSGSGTAEWPACLAAAPILFLPWLLLPLFADWPAVFRKIPSDWRNRRADGSTAWLWIWILCTAAILACLRGGHPSMVLAAAAPAAVLAGRSVMKLSYTRSRCFFGAAAALSALAGLTLVLAETYLPLREAIPANLIPGDILPPDLLPELPSEITGLLPRLGGVMYSGAVLVLLAVALLFFTRTALPGGALLLTAFLLTAGAAPWQYLTIPSLNAATASENPEAAPSREPGPTSSTPLPAETGTPLSDAPAAAPPAPEQAALPQTGASANPEAPSANL